MKYIDAERLEKAKELYPTANADQRYVLECLFPELKESEDERIRETLLNYFKDYKTQEEIGVKRFFGIPTDDIIAWLEKQSNTIPNECVFRPLVGTDIKLAAKQAIEQQGVLAKEIVLAFNGAYIPVGGKAADIIVNEYNSWLEKQGETFTKKDVDDAYVEGMAFAKDELEKQGRIDNCHLEGSTNTVMTDSKKNQVEPKFKKKSQRIISAEAKESLYDKPATIDIDKMVDDYANNEEFGKPLNCMVRAYRQGLKDAIGKIVSESAWSEEDEEMLDGIILRCEKYGHQEQINWLKSIKQRIKGE